MDELILKKVFDTLKEDKKVALVTLTEIAGSTPRDEGSLMVVWENGEIFGSIGGGKIEYTVIQESIEAIKENKSRTFSHSLTPNGDLKMQCGGGSKGIYKNFCTRKKINNSWWRTCWRESVRISYFFRI